MDRSQQEPEPVRPLEIGRRNREIGEHPLDDVAGDAVLAADVVVDDRRSDVRSRRECPDRPAEQMRLTGELERGVDHPLRGPPRVKGGCIRRCAFGAPACRMGSICCCRMDHPPAGLDVFVAAARSAGSPRTVRWCCSSATTMTCSPSPPTGSSRRSRRGRADAGRHEPVRAIDFDPTPGGRRRGARRTSGLECSGHNPKISAVWVISVNPATSAIRWAQASTS